MSKNRNRARLNKAQTNNDYYKILLNTEYPLYWDDGLCTYPVFKRGTSNSIKKRRIYSYQYRMYRSWKYNRKTQWKCKQNGTAEVY